MKSEKMTFSDSIEPYISAKATLLLPSLLHVQEKQERNIRVCSSFYSELLEIPYHYFHYLYIFEKMMQKTQLNIGKEMGSVERFTDEKHICVF